LAPGLHQTPKEAFEFTEMTRLRMQYEESLRNALSRWPTVLITIFLVINTLAFGQGLMSERRSMDSRFPDSSSLPTPVKSHTPENPYRPITPTESLHWFISGTIGPAHLAGVTFVSACGTAVNRPREYGPHWEGFANRFGIGMAGSATSNAMEAGAGLILREDPRYFRVPQQAFKFRVGNVARLTFLARNESGRSEPAYARYIGIVGSNFLSNTWRVHSEANVKDAVLRSSEGFAGCMAANAFKEFWPDVKRHVFRKYTRSSNLGTQVQARIPR
jgi:hypothetical protein